MDDNEVGILKTGLCILRPTREVNRALPKCARVDHLPPIRYNNNVGVGQHRSLSSMYMQETV